MQTCDPGISLQEFPDRPDERVDRIRCIFLKVHRMPTRFEKLSTDEKTCVIIRLGLMKTSSFRSDLIIWTPNKHVAQARGVDWSLVLNGFLEVAEISCTGRRVPQGYPKQYQEGTVERKRGPPRQHGLYLP